MKKYISFLFLLVGLSQVINAQVKIGGKIDTKADNSAVLELESTTRGLLLARVASTSSIANPVEGLLIYDLSAHAIKVFNGTNWILAQTTTVSPAPPAPSPAPAAAPSVKKDTEASGTIVVPVGTEEERPATPVTGMIRFNTTSKHFEGYNGTDWVKLDL